MKKFKRISCSLVFVLSFMIPSYSRADMFGGDVAVLVQILANALKQLYELQQIVQSGQDTLHLLRDINAGINDSLRVVDSIAPYVDPGLYKDFKKVQDVLNHLRGAYGAIVDSPDREVFEQTDGTVAEAVSLNNSIYEYTKELDVIGERIKEYSHSVSPGGAQKLTAQSMGVLIHVLNQQLRAQATGLKLNAQHLAIENKKEKAQAEQFLKESNTLKAAMKTNNVSFSLPRF